MPLQKLQFRPGVNREGTTLSNEGGWYDCDKVRFRSGYPEKIGGWAALSYNTFLGVCRSLWNWVTLKGYNLMGVGTNLKMYVEYGGSYNDVTPIRVTTTNTATFAASAGSKVITVTDASVGAYQAGDFVTYSGATSLGGNITAAVLNKQYQITSYVSSTSYTITASVAANSSDVGNGGGAVTAKYQISIGSDITTAGTGWGAGPWNAGSSSDPWAHGWGTGYTVGITQQLRLWSQANFGEVLLFAARQGPIYAWAPGSGTTPDFTTPGALVSGTDVPAVVNELMVADNSRIVIAFGCSDLGSYPQPQDPMLVRWSAQESYTDWTPSATNSAGSYRLSHGSYIVSALQTRQEILIWTDTALYSMQYIGAPYIFGFTLLADNISIVSPNSAATAAGVVYWMGTDKFYVYSGRAETLPCAVRSFVYDDFNRTQQLQVFASTNEGFSEVWWFYPSISGPNGTGTIDNPNTTVDKYVIFNYLDRVWYYGNMARTAWIDSGLRSYPQATTYTNIIVEHEAAIDDGTTNPPTPIPCYVQSSDFDIGDGHNYGFVWRMIPDVTFDGSLNPSQDENNTDNYPTVKFTLRPRINPGSGYSANNSPSVKSANSYINKTIYTVQEFTEIIYTRARGRQMAVRIESDKLGTQWQLGVPRLDVRPDGRR